MENPRRLRTTGLRNVHLVQELDGLLDVLLHRPVGVELLEVLGVLESLDQLSGLPTVGGAIWWRNRNKVLEVNCCCCSELRLDRLKELRGCKGVLALQVSKTDS